MPKITKVIDPAKIVTDPVMLSVLAKAGIDKDYVEFYQDYALRDKVNKRKSPYAKFYRDLKSKMEFMVISGLPMVKPDGAKIEVGWIKQGNKYISKANLFSAIVEGRKITLTCLSDQPYGAKQGDEVVYRPQLFLNNIEQLPITDKPALLPVDPINENYHQNVLEWDYGTCKRRLRIIEGRIHGSWIFPSNPNGNVRIKYNQTGQYRIKLGGFKVNDDEEFILQSIFDEAEYPFVVSDSATYYPDAEPESTSVDGHVMRGPVEETWATIRVGAGSSADDSVADVYLNHIDSHPTTDRWDWLVRSIFLFDSSGLPDNASISDAVLSIYGSSKFDGLSIAPKVNIYSSNPASNTALVAADFTTLGTTAYSTDITYASWVTGAYNDFTLNTDGKNAISKTSVSKFGTRDVDYDVGGATPAWSTGGSAYSRAMGYTADQGTGYKPKLVVTYTAGTEKTSSDAGSGTEGTPVQSAALTGSETGSGIGAIIARLLATFDAGTGVEVGGLLKDLFASELGRGSDSLKVKIETPTKGGGMKLWI